jgi:hypothetical protein
MQLQFEYHQNLESKHVTGRDEFVSLTRACIGEEPVSVQEIKNELIKAIEVMQSKLDVNDKLGEILSSTILALNG